MTESAAKPEKETAAPLFDAAFLDRLEDLIRWRRDVRRFRPDPVDDALVTRLIGLAALAPSVGNSQPWRFVTVAEPARRKRVIENFEACNSDALKDYEGEQAKLYASLKLAGLREAPVHLAVFCDTETQAGRGLGMGWVSIFEPGAIGEILDVPLGWALVAYLCIGWPVEEHLDPELERAGWQQRLDTETFITRR